MRSVATPLLMEEGQGKAPLGSGESTRTTGNVVILRDLSVTIIRLTDNLAWGHIHGPSEPTTLVSIVSPLAAFQ